MLPASRLARAIAERPRRACLSVEALHPVAFGRAGHFRASCRRPHRPAGQASSCAARDHSSKSSFCQAAGWRLATRRLRGRRAGRRCECRRRRATAHRQGRCLRFWLRDRAGAAECRATGCAPERRRVVPLVAQFRHRGFQGCGVRRFPYASRFPGGYASHPACVAHCAEAVNTAAFSASDLASACAVWLRRRRDCRAAPPVLPVDHPFGSTSQ